MDYTNEDRLDKIHMRNFFSRSNIKREPTRRPYNGFNSTLDSNAGPQQKENFQRTAIGTTAPVTAQNISSRKHTLFEFLKN